MSKWLIVLVLALLPQYDAGQKGTEQTRANPHSSSYAEASITPAFTADGKLEPPTRYREWVYLSAGMDMNYSPGAAAPDQHTFDNVFVDPAAYRSFLQAGHWPDKTIFALEIRRAQSNGSINKRGQFQSGQVVGLEVHVRDEKHFSGGWAFFSFEGQKPAEMIPTTASCYSCHQQHGAVDTTFVQFYPTALEIAKAKKTLSAEYLKESAEK
jgi:hypothetical protein